MKKSLLLVCLVINLFVMTGLKAQLAGSYTVPGSFPSIATAIASLNLVGVSAPVTINIVAGHTETVTAGGFTLNTITGASSVNQIIFQKSGAGANPLLVAYTGGAGTPATAVQDGVWRFVGTDYVTIDGIDIKDPNTANPANMEFGYGFFKASVSNGCQNNTIRNCVITLNRANTTTASGTAANGSRGIDVVNATPSAHTTSLTITAASGANSNNRFYNNTILCCNIGISCIGFNDVSPFTFSDSGNDISNNLIGPASTGTNNLAGMGILLVNAISPTVSANTIRNIVTAVSAMGAINLRSNVTMASVSQNTVGNIASSATSSGVNAIYGIHLGTGVTTSTINSNVLTSIYNTNAGGYGARGMIINTGVPASNLFIQNNFLSDIYCFGDFVSLGSFQWATVGIHIDGAATGGVNIDFNTVHLFGSHPGYAASGGTPSSPLYVNASGGNLNVRNNILANTYDNLGISTDVIYAIYSAVSATNFATINYNDYYVGGAAPVQVLGFLGGNQTTLPAIQTAFGGNLNSINALPVFVSNTDLHLQPVGANAPIDNQGVVVAGITVDIDNQTRSLSTPDIGADEFSVPACSTASGGTLGAASATACAGQTLVATSTGVSTGLGTSYLWKVGVTPGGPYAPVSGGTGSATTSYTSPPLGAGIYYVVLETTCSAASLTAVSNEGTLTVIALPTSTASVSSATICQGQNLNLLGAGSAATYSWSGPGGFSSTSQNPVMASAHPTISGSYTLWVLDSGCESPPSTVSAVVYPYPQTLTLTPATASVCPGISQLLSAQGGVFNPILNFGTQANQNGASTTSSGYPAPYSVYYGGQRMQILILASELHAAGFVIGTPIQNIEFPVASLGANWGVTMMENQNFQVNIGSTNLTALTSFQTGLTNVVAPSNFVPAVGYANTHAFSSPYIWNGSNIIIETTFSNNLLGSAGDLVVQYNSPTNFQSTVVYRVDSQTAPTVASATSVSFIYSARPDFKLNGTAVGTMSWTPSTGLSSTTGQNVMALPLSDITYTVTASIGSCSTHTTVPLNIAPTPTLSVAATSTLFCAGNEATLTASGAETYTWSSTGNTNTLLINPSATTIYTVSGKNYTCAAVSETINIVVNPLPVITGTSSSNQICIGESATLTASGASTYSWDSGPLTDTFVVMPTINTTYSVTGTDNNGCSDETTVSLVVNNLPVITVAPSSPTVCVDSEVIFTASGAHMYLWSSGSADVTETITAAASAVYTVTGTSTEGCISTQTVELTTNPLPQITVSPLAPTACVDSEITFTASGANTYSWSSGSANVTETITVTASAVYTVTGTSTEGCTSTQTVELTANPLPQVTISPLTPTVCANGVLILTASGATSYSWSPGGLNTATLSANTQSTAAYTVEGLNTQGCRNTASVTVTVDLCTGLNEQTASLLPNVNLYPNPSTGIITADFEYDGYKEILVLNSVGALIAKITTEERVTRFDLSAYAKGVYFLNLKTNGTSANYKIILH